MPNDHATARYRKLYAQLLRLYPKPYRERFGEGMEQTFNDLLRERAEEQRGVFGYALWMFAETLTGILKTNLKNSVMQNKNIVRVIAVVALILLIPLVAMQFTDEVNWTLSDFVIMGILLLGAGLTYEFVARKMRTGTNRLATGLAVMTGLVLIWLNLAVGIIGSEDNPANLLYGGVLAVGIIGALISRFEPQGMARTLFATGIAQALVPVIALIIWKPGLTAGEGPGIVGVFGLNAFFVALWLISAWLFRKDARKQPLAVAGAGGLI